MAAAFRPAGYFGLNQFRRIEVTVAIVYRDRSGEVTHRDVQIRGFAHDSFEPEFFGYCKLRSAERSFKFAGVLSAEARATHEQIPDLASWLARLYEGTPDGRCERFMNEYLPALLALHAVAKADGQLKAAELAVIDEFMVANGLKDQAARHLVLEDVRQWAPQSARAFGDALRALQDAAIDLREEVLACAKKIVATDKTVREAELRALERVRQILKLPKS